LRISPSLSQGSVCTQGHHHRHRGACCQPSVAWALLGLPASRQTALALPPAVAQPAPYRQPRPCGLLPPPGGHRRGRRAPAPARFSSGLLVLGSRQNVRRRPDRSVDRGGQPRPALVLCRRSQGRALAHEARARRHRRRGPLRCTSPPGAACTARRCPTVRADHMSPPPRREPLRHRGGRHTTGRAPAALGRPWLRLRALAPRQRSAFAAAPVAAPARRHSAVPPRRRVQHGRRPPSDGVRLGQASAGVPHPAATPASPARGGRQGAVASRLHGLGGGPRLHGPTVMWAP
jgi:hypothetical protein